MADDSFNIAIEGCGHGELDKIYQSMAHIEQLHNLKIDLLLCCGDFQSVRNQQDLDCLACPPKYRKMVREHPLQCKEPFISIAE